MNLPPFIDIPSVQDNHNEKDDTEINYLVSNPHIDLSGLPDTEGNLNDTDEMRVRFIFFPQRAYNSSKCTLTFYDMFRNTEVVKQRYS